MLAVLYRHGPPPTAKAFVSLIEEDIEADGWRMYMANMSRLIIAGMSSNKSKAPWWSDIVRGKPSEPEKTGKQVFDDIIRKAMNRGD